MHSQIALLDNLKIEYKKQLRLMEKLETRLRELPCGSLSYKKGNYYRILKDQQILIPANWCGANVLIKELKERQYIKKSLPLLKNNVHCYEQVLKTAPFHSNPAFTENLIYESEGGLLVRSKAEAAIATKLEQNNLIFRYEPELKLGKLEAYGDYGYRLGDNLIMTWEDQSSPLNFRQINSHIRDYLL